MSSGKDEGTEVTIEEVATRDISESVSASGKIQPEVEVKIQSEVSGLIIELPVKEGDEVQKGQVLVKINPDVYTAALSRAEAALNSAKSNLSSAKARQAQAQAQYNANDLNYKRQKKLFDDGAISRADFENATVQWQNAAAEVTAAEESIKSAEFSIESAMAGVNEASDNLRRTTIVSPINGTVTALNKETGESVLGNNMMSGDVIMKISALESMEVNVEVNESDIVKVQAGDTALIEVDSYRDEVFKGLVTQVGNTALNALGDQMNLNQVTNFSVKIRLLPSSYSHLLEAGNKSPFKPGMSATVDILTGEIKGALTIPIKAVASRQDTSESNQEDEVSTTRDPFTVVFVMDTIQLKARIRIVQTGMQNDEHIAIQSGLNLGEKIITGPYDQVSKSLMNGSVVKKKEKRDIVP
ncbi:MAG: efflux RND transporter periplasmic adaptor subunit [Flavobacteriales bacterium]